MISLIRLTVLILCVISCLSFFSKPRHEQHLKNMGHPWEEYDPTYFDKFQTINSLIHYSDSCIGANQKSSLRYYNFVAGTIRKRFYHGYSYYQFSDNPLSFLAGRFVRNDLSVIINPADIMKHPMAACGQQSFVLMEIFRQNEIHYRKVTFPGHFAVEGFIENEWRFFDMDLEPNIPLNRLSVDSLQAEDKFYSAYAKTGLKPEYLRETLGTPMLGKINEIPVPKTILFQTVCSIIVSKWFLLAAFILSFWGSIQRRILKKIFKTANDKQQFHNAAKGF